jgi:carboxyl-terminal processing protease
MNSRFKFFFVSSSLALVVLLLVGVKLGRGASNSDDPYKHFGVFSEVITRIKSDYVEEPDMKNVTLGALNGLLESIDPFASYLSADQYKQFQELQKSPKAGVGLILSRRMGYVSVVDAIPGSPADKAGINTFDIIETIKGVSTRDMPLAFAEIILAGEPGTNVDLQILRARKPEPEKLTLGRVKLVYPAPTTSMVSDGAAHITIPSLEGNNPAEMRKSIEGILAKGARKLILDLRNCSTGSPATGIELARLFLDKGQIGFLQGQRVPKQSFDSEATKQLFKQPVVILTNRGTANAAETFAAALLDNKRADVVGERTYGDAAQRKALALDDGSAVYLSVAKYYAPSGKAIQDTGVVPNHPVNDLSAGTDADPDGPGPEPEEKSKEDAILKKALEVLSGKSAVAANTASNPTPALQK